MPAQPPAKQNPALQGLAAAASPDAQIAQRQKVNSVFAPAPQPAAGAPFALNPGMTDPQGMFAALKAAGYTGQRTTDIPLPEEEIPFEELMRRSNALLGQR